MLMVLEGTSLGSVKSWGLYGRSLGHFLLKRTERLGSFLLSLLSDYEVGGLVLLSVPDMMPSQAPKQGN